MNQTGTACFVRRPRVISELARDAQGCNQKYEIVKEICLARIDYENFTTDLLADRQFIEEYAPLCFAGEVWRCLFVRQKLRRDGILVVPNGSHIAWAAYLK